MRHALVAMMVVGAVSPAAADSLSARARSAHTSDTVRVPFLGVMAGAGVPDGLTASLAVRPVRALRVELGAAHDGVGPGVRGGLTWIPFASWFTPTLGVAYGRFFERDANPLVRTLTGDPTIAEPVLERVGYDYATAQVGLELGRQRFTFYLHAGITRVTGQIHGLDATANTDPDAMVTITTADPDIRLVTVSAKLGFILYLF
jgi:hypothetical protein